ncbi:MAG: hypothetical protein SWJ54_13070, partial [Cyanobacteriota bacterium]|nr:hypothetical protein [Cyanobacteriota bacterium]
FLTEIIGVDLPDSIKSKLSSIGDASFTLSEAGISLTYLEDLVLDINSLLDDTGDLIKDVVNQLTDRLLGDGDPDIDGTQLVLSQPKVELVTEYSKKQLSVSGSFNQTEFDINLGGENTALAFKMPSLDVESLKNILSNLIGEIPGFAQDLLNILSSLDLPDLKIEVSEGELAVSYLGEVKIAEIINSLSEILGLGENVLSDSLTVKNPGLRIAKDQEGNFDYQISIGEFSPTEVVSLLGDIVGIDALPSVIQNELDKVGKVGLIASNKGLTLNYLDDITLDVNSLIDSEGFLKDAANIVTEAFLGDGDENADGTQLVLSESQLEFVKDEKTKELSFAGNFNGTDFKFGLDIDSVLNSSLGGLTTPKLSELEFNLPKLDAEKLKEAFETIANADLPEFAEDLLTTLASLANFDVELSEEKFAVTYQGTLNITNIINSLSSTLGLGDSLLSEPLSVTNPGLRVAKDNAGNKLYEVSIGEFSPTEAVNFLSDTLDVELPDTIQNELNNVGKVGLSVSNQGFTLTYLDDVVVDVNSLVNIEGIVQDAANAITKELLGDGDDAEGTQLVLVQPELEFTTQNNTQELSFAGNFNGEDFKVDFAFNSTSGKLTTPKISQLEFSLPQLDAGKIETILNSLAGISLPGFVTSFLDKLATVTNNLQIGFKDEGFQLTSLGDIDISTILQSLVPNLSVDSFNVENPGLIIEYSPNGGLEFGINVGEFSPGQLIDLLVGLLPDSVPLPTDVMDEIKRLGNASLSLTTAGISVTYLDNLTLDLNSLIGDNFGSLGFVTDAINKVSEVVLGDADSTLDGTQLELVTPNFEWKTDSFGFGGFLNDKEFNLGFGEAFEAGFEFNYEFGDLSLSSILGEIPGLEGFKIDDTQLSFSDEFNFEGKLDFTEKSNKIYQFINEYLGVDHVGANLEIDADNGVSLEGILAGNIPLLSIKDFKATLNDVALGLEISKVDQALGIGGSITLEGYDPVQTSEPPLTLYGDLKLDPKAITGSFQMRTEDELSWENPFGLPNTSMKNLALQIGATYIKPWVDNVGLVGDLKFGNYDLKAAFLIDINDPQKFALELTVNEPLPLLDLYLDPVSSYVENIVGNEVPIMKQGIEFLDSIIDLEIVSIDGPDPDNKIDPLISIVPVGTKIAQETLSQGIGVNGAVTAWGQTGSLAFNINPFSLNPTMAGSLKISEIDVANLGLVKISGVEDSVSGATDLNLDLKVSLIEQYLQGDGQLEIFDREVAKVDFKVSPFGIEIKDFGFDILITELDVDNLNIYTIPK